MSDEQQQQMTTQTMADSIAYNSNANIIRIRLDTEPIIKQFQLDILGAEEVPVIDKESGQAMFITKQVTKPLVNEQGARALTSRIRLIMNQHNSQGNIDKGEFYMIISYHVQEIAWEMLVNEDQWEIKPEASAQICNMMWSAYHAFLTRAIDDKERPSLQNLSTATGSTQSINPQQRGFIQRMLGGK